jgi:hypothetical protein
MTAKAGAATSKNNKMDFLPATAKAASSELSRRCLMPRRNAGRLRGPFNPQERTATMTDFHSLAPKTEIAISAQVWVCDACGCQDAKSCGCKSTAHMEKMAAKKEAHRQAARRSREKAEQNQGSRDNHAAVDNTEDFLPAAKPMAATATNGKAFDFPSPAETPKPRAKHPDVDQEQHLHHDVAVDQRERQKAEANSLSKKHKAEIADLKAEHKAEIAELKAKNKVLEAKNNELEAENKQLKADITALKIAKKELSEIEKRAKSGTVKVASKEAAPVSEFVRREWSRIAPPPPSSATAVTNSACESPCGGDATKAADDGLDIPDFLKVENRKSLTPEQQKAVDAARRANGGTAS